MPTYTYKCQKCALVSDQVRAIEDRDLRQLHVDCGGFMLRQYVWSNVSLKSREPWEVGKQELGDMKLEDHHSMQEKEKAHKESQYKKKLEDGVTDKVKTLEAEGGLYRHG
jgi:hypothetical protein